MKIVRIVPNISSELFAASRDFYVELFDLVVSVELDDWYLQLMAPEDRSLNIGFVKPAHELFAGHAAPAGTYGVVLTIHVDDVDAAYGRAQRMGAEIAEEIGNEDYGQRHFLVIDPNGLLLNRFPHSRVPPVVSAKTMRAREPPRFPASSRTSGRPRVRRTALDLVRGSCSASRRVRTEVAAPPVVPVSGHPGTVTADQLVRLRDAEVHPDRPRRHGHRVPATRRGLLHQRVSGERERDRTVVVLIRVGLQRPRACGWSNLPKRCARIVSADELSGPRA
jgi:uncharacterized glyoxalase superfamily protein PhnB